MLLTEESSRDKAASSGPENTGSRRLAGAVQQLGMKGDYAQTSQMLFSKWKVNRHVTLKPLPLLDIEVQQRG